MKNCVFCSIVEQEDKELREKAENTILYEDDNLIIIPALGMSIPNYLMLVAKNHINGFAELEENDLKKLETLLDNICDEYYSTLGIYPIIFEHGSLSKGRHPLSITHAHIHIIPVNLSEDNTNSLFRDLKLEEKGNIKSLNNMKYKDYWMYRSQSKRYYMSHTIIDAPRSCFIKLVAKESGFDKTYEWRNPDNNRLTDVEETINTFKKLNIKK